MRICCKCNSKIKLSSIVKSTLKRSGLIECNKCKSKFRMKYYKIITTIVIFFMVIITTNINMNYEEPLINNFIKTLFVGIITMVIYIVIIFLMPWEEK